MIQLFLEGGFVMWPILLLSVVTVGVVVERAFFLVAEARRRDPAAGQRLLHLAESGQAELPSSELAGSTDMVARVLAQGLEHRGTSPTEAMVEAAAAELDRYNRGLSVLDTAVTLGPLLGLMGTVTGMIRVFGTIGGGDLSGKEQVLTGGISQCLIAVTFGLGVAIVAVIPLNYLNTRIEKAKRQLESAMTRLELIVARQRAPSEI